MTLDGSSVLTVDDSNGAGRGGYPGGHESVVIPTYALLFDPGVDAESYTGGRKSLEKKKYEQHC